MKRTICILLAALLLLSMAACGGPGTDPAHTADPDTAPAPEQTGEPAVSDPARDSARAVFDPETDYDNACGGLMMDELAQTEETVYWHPTSRRFLYYYDRPSGESGVLCPRPECVHDGSGDNPDCGGWIGPNDASLSLYQGKLWWIGGADPNISRLGVFRMDPDGTDRELVRELGQEHETQGQKYYFHRGYIYYFRMDSRVSGAEIGSRFVVARIPMEGAGGAEEIFSTDSRYVIQGTLRFLGDAVYCYLRRDDGGPDGAEPRQYIEILRWEPGMTEPVCLYRTDRAENWINTAAFQVTRDGEIWFVVSQGGEAADADQTGPAETVCRLDGTGQAQPVFDFADPETQYTVRCISEGVAVAAAQREQGSAFQLVWIKDLTGKTLFRGGLSLDPDSSTDPAGTAADGAGSAGLRILTADPDRLLAVLVEQGGDGLALRTRLVEYRITAEGTVPAVLATDQGT